MNEKIYMTTRLFRLFCERYQYAPIKGNTLFNTYKIWEYIEQAYGVLHLNGDDSALSDIEAVLVSRGAVL